MEAWEAMRQASQNYLDGLITEDELQVKLVAALTNARWVAGDRVMVTDLAEQFVA